MQTVFEVLLVLGAIWFVWRVIRIIGSFRQIPEPPDPVGIREPVRRGPRLDSGAVALEEPEGDE